MRAHREREGGPRPQHISNGCSRWVPDPQFQPQPSPVPPHSFVRTRENVGLETGSHKSQRKGSVRFRYL